MALESVYKAYGAQPVLHGFSCRIPAGKAVALLGPSGAGKTTVLRIFLGLVNPDSGAVLGGGQRFGCVFQEDRLCGGVSALHNVRMVLPRPLFGRAEEALRALGLSAGDVVKPARALSGGQRRRVALARAVAFPSEAILLDEPFKGLDAENKQRAYDYVKQNRAGRSLLLITHDTAEAEALGLPCLWLPGVQESGKMSEETTCGADYFK